MPATLSVSPIPAGAGSNVTISGAGHTPSTAVLLVADLVNSREYAMATADASGAVSFSWPVQIVGFYTFTTYQMRPQNPRAAKIAQCGLVVQ